jgi:hypothetical protein
MQHPGGQNKKGGHFVPQQFQQYQHQNYPPQCHGFNQQQVVNTQGPNHPIERYKPHPPLASQTLIEQALEAKYFKMICFNYGDPGHFVGTCI